MVTVAHPLHRWNSQERLSPTSPLTVLTGFPEYIRGAPTSSSPCRREEWGDSPELTAREDVILEVQNRMLSLFPLSNVGNVHSAGI